MSLTTTTAYTVTSLWDDDLEDALCECVADDCPLDH